MALSRALRQPLAICPQCLRSPQPRRGFATSLHHYAEGSLTPRVAAPSFWRNLVPKFLRRDSDLTTTPGSKEWNPATPFIVLGLVVGSFAINILSLRREMLNFSRKTEAKLETLREVLQRLKAGEKVDVEKLLGTGDPKEEQEWEDVMQELESTDMLLEAQKKKEAKATAKEAERIANEAQSPKAPREESEKVEGERKAGRPKFLM